ncbi:ATP-binding domain-containing protein, partial [bacterium]|nr:ATP-binding domain-containing protein [bacterium]
LNFQKDYENAKLIKLEQNYRSTSTILTAANEVIKNNEERLDKNLYSTKGQGEKITLFEAEDNYSESRYIASKIENLRISKDKIAILYRTNSQSRSIEEALMNASIPYKIVGGLKFYERKEIKDTIAYLKLIYNKKDSQALRRIINSPARGIGETTLSKLSSWADSNEISMFDAIEKVDEIEEINSRSKGLLKNFHSMITKMSEVQNDYSLDEYISYILDYSGYAPTLRQEDTTEAQSRLENLEEFINVAYEFEQDDFVLDKEDDLGVLGNFLTQVALVSDVDELDNDEENPEKSVTLMTLHAAKGLEYPVVFIAGLEEGIFPHNRSLLQNNSNELEEERRLMYVGITRAKDKLYLTYAKSRKVWGNYQTNKKSRFLDEIPYDLIEEEGDYNEKPSYSSKFSKQFSNNSYKYNSENTSRQSTFKQEEAPKPSSNSLLSSIARIKQSAKKVQETTQNAVDYKKINVKVVKKQNPEVKKASIQEMIQRAKNAALPKEQSRKLGVLPVGSRVFHPNFGVGNISKVEDNSYIVDFTKAGLKTLDISTSGLKTF